MLENETAPVTMEQADTALTTVPEPSPEAPTPAAAPATEVAQAPAPETGVPRDEQGRFTSPAPKAEVPEASPEAVAPAPESPEPTAVEPAVEYPPFSYRADNQDHSIPGSAVGDEGIFIPKASVQEVQQLLSAGKAASGSFRQRLSESATREQQAIDRAAAAEAQAQQVLSHFESLIDSGQIADWLQNVQLNWPILKAEAKAKGLELAQQSERKELERYREQEQQVRLRPVMDSTLQQEIRSQGAQAGLDEDTMTRLYETLKGPEYQTYLWPKAPYDDPANGIRKGEVVIDRGVVSSALRLVQATRPVTPAVPTKMAKAMAEQAKPVVKPVIPPTVGAKTRVPRQGSPIPQFKTAEEADEFLMRGDLSGLVTD